MLGFGKCFKPVPRQVGDKPTHIPPGQGRAEGLLQLANWITTHNAEVSWRKTIVIIWIWKELMEPAGQLKDGCSTQNLQCPSWGSLQRTWNQVWTLHPNQATATQTRAAEIHRATVNMAYLGQLKNQKIRVKTQRMKSVPCKVSPKAGIPPLLTSVLGTRIYVLNIQKGCFRLDTRKKNSSVIEVANWQFIHFWNSKM